MVPVTEIENSKSKDTGGRKRIGGREGDWRWWKGIGGKEGDWREGRGLEGGKGIVTESCAQQDALKKPHKFSC